MFEFSFERRMQFYETDAMGIIHHANYLRLFEEARLEFLNQVYGQTDQGLLDKINYPLVRTEIDYKSSLRFNDLVKVKTQVSCKGARLIFDYSLWTKSVDKACAFGKTVHVAFDMDKAKTVRLPEKLLNFITK